MAFITYDQYQQMYVDSAMTPAQFNLFERQAERVLDVLTTGLDNVHKLYEYFPIKERDVQNITDAMCHLTNLLYEIDIAERAYSLSVGADGLVSSKVVASRSSGSESISYNNNISSTVLDASKSEASKQEILARTARFYLAGTQDSNGVNLLYMGAYPYV